MRKDELVHLHSLLALLRSEYERRGVASAEAFAAYDDLDVSPMAIYGSKDDHGRAVRALASALASVSDSSDPDEALPAEEAADRSESESDTPVPASSD